MAMSGLLRRLVIGLSVLAGASAQGWQMRTVGGGSSGLCAGAMLCGDNGVASGQPICANTWNSSADLHWGHPCNSNGWDEACIQALCEADPLCGGYSAAVDRTVYWLMPAHVWMFHANAAYECWAKPTTPERWQMLTGPSGVSGTCNAAKLCEANGDGDGEPVCGDTSSDGELLLATHQCGNSDGYDEACIRALCEGDALCAGYQRNIAGDRYWLMPHNGFNAAEDGWDKECWQKPTPPTTDTPTVAPHGGVRPGDAVEVKCASESAYHPAAVHNVSSGSIVVVYELMGHLYYCTPKVWRTVVANQEEACGPYEGILPAWGGDKCCPSSCGECGTTDCHTRPGGRNSCCTRRIPDHYVCGKEGRTAPCTLVPTLPFPQVRRLRGVMARLLQDWSPTAWANFF